MSSQTSNSAHAASGAGAAAVNDDLIGKAVYNENDDKIGDVQDIKVGSNGTATEIIIGAGGFLGMGKHDVALPYDQLTREGDKLILRGYTKEQLKQMPAAK